MARVKAGSVAVELVLDKDQFNKDFKAATREVASMQKQLSLEMERNKVKFAVDGMDKDWADKLFGSTVIGKIRNASKETQLLNTQIGFQRNKVDIARAAWEGIVSAKGATSAAAVAAEKSFMREQMALVGLKKQLDGTATASGLMGGALVSAASTAAAGAAALAGAYAAAAKAAVAWGQAVNDIVDETGMADQEAARLTGTMNIVGLSSEEAAGAIAKMARSVSTAAAAQQAAKAAGKESVDVFTRYGIAITDASGNMLEYTQILANIQEVHRNMQDGLQKTAMEMEIFGRAGYKMNDFLNLSKDQMAEYTKKIDAMGLSIKDSAKYENFNKQLNEMALALKGIAVTITGDDIPAMTAMLAKMTEFSAWIKENKDGIDDFKSSMLTLGSWVMKPFTVGMELGIAGLKKYIEAVDAAAKANKQPVSDSTLDDISAASKVAEASLKRQSDAVKAKAAAEKDLIFAQRELADAVATLQGKTLEVTLRNIEREREAWLKKTNDEVAATQWAEKAKTKAFQDAIDARLGPEVAAAKRALLEGGDVGRAIAEASQKRKDEEKATYDARQYVKKFYGIAEPGDEIKTLQVDRQNNTITQLVEIAKALTIPRDKNGRTVFDQYQPDNKKLVVDRENNTITQTPSQDNTYNISVNISRDPNDNEDALANKVAKKIIDETNKYNSKSTY